MTKYIYIYCTWRISILVWFQFDLIAAYRYKSIREDIVTRNKGWLQQ